MTFKNSPDRYGSCVLEFLTMKTPLNRLRRFAVATLSILVCTAASGGCPTAVANPQQADGEELIDLFENHFRTALIHWRQEKQRATARSGYVLKILYR